MSLRKKAVSGMIWSIIHQFSSIGIRFIISIILARILLPAEFGIVGMIAIFLAVGSVLINSGLTTSLIRTPDADDVDYSTVFYFNLAGSAVVYLLLFMAAPFIARFFDQPILKNVTRIISLTFIIGAFSSVQATRLTQMMDFKTQIKIGVPPLILGGIIGVILAYNGYGVWSLVWMAVAQSFLTSFQYWRLSHWKPSFTFSVVKFKYHFKFGYMLLFSGLLDTFFTNIYTVIIGKFFLPAQLGFYTQASTLVQLPTENISWSLTKVTLPLFASIQNDNERLKSAYEKILKIVIFAVAPMLAILGVLATPLIRFLFTEKWLPTVPYFHILCLAGILYPLHIYNLNIIAVKGRSDLYLKLEIIKKILTVMAIFLSIPFGILGLLWGIVLTTYISVFINMHVAGKFISYTAFQQIRDIMPILGISIIAGFATYGIDQILIHIGSWDIVRLIVGGVGGVLIFLGLAILLKFPTISDFKSIILKK